MAISNITKTGGTTANPIISAVIDTISFNNIPAGGKGTKGSAFWNHSVNVDVWKDNGDGTKWKPAVNAVDIDWNGAELGSSTINTTGELLALIKSMADRIEQLENGMLTISNAVIQQVLETTPTEN